MLSKRIPALKTISTYQMAFFKKDFSAALSTFVITIPQSMAVALIIGIEPVYGLYTAIISIFIASIFSSSENMITSPTNAMGLLIAAATKNFLPSQDFFSMLFLLTFVVGLLQFLMGLLRFGKAINYVSHPVMVGFMTGAGLLIGLGQLHQLLGISIPNSSHMSILEKLYNLTLRLNQTNLYSLGLGLLTVVLILIFKSIKKTLPAAFFSIIITSILVIFFRLEQQNVRLTGELQGAFPSFKMLDFWLLFSPVIWKAAVPIAIVGLVEAISISKSIATKSGQSIDVDQEFFGQGLTNMLSSFFQGLATSGSFSNTANNFLNGAKTRVSAMLTSICIVIMLLFFGSFAKYIALPALGGVMLILSYNLIDLKEIRGLIKFGGVDLFVAFVTFISTILFDLDIAIYIGVVFSVLAYLKNTGSADIRLLVPSKRFKGSFKEREINWVNTHKAEVLLVQFQGNLYFGLASDLETKLNSLAGHAKAFVLRMKRVDGLDLSCLEVIQHFVDRIRKEGGAVLFSGLNQQNFELLSRFGLVDLLGRECFFMAEEYLMNSSNAAIEQAKKMTSHEVKADR